MPLPASLESDRALPDKTDVAIIGGGIAGVATALELAERGLSIVLCEKGIIAGEQSSRNWGWCRQMGRDRREIPLIQVSMGLWRQMRQRTGEETGYRECGIAYLCESDAKLEKREHWYRTHARPNGLSSRMISAADAQAMTPGCTIGWKGGLFTPNDGRAEPALAVPAMARAARKAGALIFQNCAVRGIEREGGRVSGIVTENGAVACDAVVLAGGAWSRRFCNNIGIELPQLTVINSVMRTTEIEAGVTHSVSGGNFAIRKRLDGGYSVAHSVFSMADMMPDSFRLLPAFWPTLKNEWRDFRFRLGSRFLDEARLKRRWAMDEQSPFEQVRILDPAPVQSIQNEALAALRKALPVFQKARIAEQWAGVIDVVPDTVPVISAIDALPGFHMATGFSGHGFGLGPGAGKLMAEIVTGETPCVDPAPFRFGRFA